MTLRALALSILAALFISAPLAGAKHDTWVEVRSPNFIVVSNAGEKEARKLAVQFEQIREVFRASLAVANTHPSPVMTVVAAKNEATMRELFPEYWEKGHAHPAGMFEHMMEMSVIAVQVDASGDNPFHTVYHEYYHSLTTPFYPGLPLWLTEGLADFYGNTVISGEYTTTGRPDPNLIYELQNNALIPLNALMNANRSSPFYTQEGKVSIFYAESWALTHYLMVGERGAHRNVLKAYLGLLSNGASQDDAAAQAFGDLKKLQEALRTYISSYSFSALQMKSPPKVTDSQLTVKALSDADVETYRADVFLLRGRDADAKPLLEDAVKTDPNQAMAHEYLGIIDFYDKQRPDAEAEFSKAIALDPNAGMARFLRAYLSLHGGMQSVNPQAEEDLREAVKEMPNFAPAYSNLAMVLVLNGKDLSEALTMANKATSLEPANGTFQLNLAQVQARMGNYDGARLSGLRALEWTKEPAVKLQAQEFLSQLSQMSQLAPGKAASATVAMTQPRGKSISITGTVSKVKCDGAFEFDLASGGETVHLRLPPGAPLTIISTGSQPASGNPCTSLEGKNVLAGYLADPGSDGTGTLQTLRIVQPEAPAFDPARGNAHQDANVIIVEGTVANITCNGNEMWLTLSVNSTAITLHTKDFAKVVFTANTRSAMGDMAPCTDLKDLPLRVGFIPQQQEKSAGEIQGIVIEK